MWYPAPALLVFHFLAPALAATSSAPATTITPLTCPSRTVNYITHGLPQQCLASSRKVNLTSVTTELSGIQTANLTSTPSTASESQNTSTVLTNPSSSPTAVDTETEPRVASPTSDQDSTAANPSRTEATESLTSTAADGADEDSPLEDGKFLSFEDWKRENLKKSGQSEHVGKGAGFEHREPRKRTALVQDSLDTFGDDAEIDLDFSGFVSEGFDPPNQGQQPRASKDIREHIEIEPGRAPRAGARSKDAGTTCKERFNYASFDCAANVLKTNPEAKSPSAVLGNNKDSYMLNECSAPNKFLILELCDDISIDTIVVANFEFFSSTFRTFRVSVSDKYPVKIDKWRTLGTFEARNTREVQAFLVENPVIWTRYLRIEFLTHYGNEYYCPISLVRVHGTTMLEEYKHDLESLHMEDDEKDIQDSDEAVEVDGLVAEELLRQPESVEPSPESDDLANIVISEQSQTQFVLGNATHVIPLEFIATPMPTSPANFSAPFHDSIIPKETLDMCASIEETTSTLSGAGQQATTKSPSTESTAITTSISTVNITVTTNGTLCESLTDNDISTPPRSQSVQSKADAADNSTTTRLSSSSAVNSTKVSASPTQAHTPAPTMQESFFKSVQKRLQMLEANSSLSLQYIEEQSRALRDAFQKVEQKQLAKTTSFLESLNSTVLNELRDFRQQYDQLWQSTVIELEMQRERYQQENLAINARLGVLADEVIFQKRMSILQSLLILICLGLVLFSKGSLNSYLELPLVRNLARSPSTRWLNLSSLDTASQSSPVNRANSAGGVRKRQGILKGHRRLPSEDSVDDALSPSDLYTPPTPISFGEPSSDYEDKEDSNRLGNPQFDPGLIKRPSTSPPVLTGLESPTIPGHIGDVGDDSIDSVLLSSPPSSLESRPPILMVEDVTPPAKQLKWQLPEG